jgi:hypothetical protein
MLSDHRRRAAVYVQAGNKRLEGHRLLIAWVDLHRFRAAAGPGGGWKSTEGTIDA